MVARETPSRTALTGGMKCQPGRPMPRKKAGRSDLQRSHHRGPRVPVIPVFKGSRAPAVTFEPASPTHLPTCCLCRRIP